MRDLEMGNDDLERNERAASSSLADAEARYGKVLEEKILLEHELLDKASLEEECQRLKDDLRGLSDSAYFDLYLLNHFGSRCQPRSNRSEGTPRPCKRTNQIVVPIIHARLFI